MAREFPSMTALLGLLAVAGYQNRDKIAEMLGGLHQNPGAAPPAGGTFAGGAPAGGAAAGGLGGLLGGLFGGVPGAGAPGGASAPGGIPGGAGAAAGGGFLGGALGQLVDQFHQNGEGDTAKSWVGHGPNAAIPPDRVEKAVGPDIIQELSQKTGISREELLARLSRELPGAIDKYTPNGTLPG